MAEDMNIAEKPPPFHIDSLLGRTPLASPRTRNQDGNTSDSASRDSCTQSLALVTSSHPPTGADHAVTMIRCIYVTPMSKYFVLLFFFFLHLDLNHCVCSSNPPSLSVEAILTQVCYFLSFIPIIPISTKCGPQTKSPKYQLQYRYVLESKKSGLPFHLIKWLHWKENFLSKSILQFLRGSH